MSPREKSDILRRRAAEVGFCRVGVTAAKPIERSDYLLDWLQAGRAGEMGYLRRNLHIRMDSSQILDGARCVIVTAMNYYQEAPHPPEDQPTGRVAMYAWGNDYHRVVRDRLKRLAALLRGDIDEPFRTRICVDTAPVLERELAAAAGVGWIGKNTMVMHQDVGSYFFLGTIVTTLELELDGPAVDHCGTCRQCLDACPTQAFPAPYEMDASRCISYLTIEHRGEISPELQPSMGAWIYGCDVCQEVCPHNRAAPVTQEPEFQIRSPGPNPRLDDVLNWTAADHKQQIRDSAMDRATLPMLQRNARIVARNTTGSPST